MVHMTRTGMLRISEPLASREGKLTLLALLMMLYVMALFISISIHEILGHGIFTVLLGGDFYAVYLSPGSGYVSFWLPPALSNAGVALIYMAGILIQLLIGAFTLFLIFPRIKNFLWGMFTLMFCIGMLVHSSLYLFMGYIYESGDTKYATALLGIQPDAFMVAGLILTGLFVLYISMVALKFLGRFIDLEDDATRSRALAMFWFPPLLFSGVISFVFSLTLPKPEFVYPFLNSAILLMFLGVAMLLVPMFTEPLKETEHRISMGSVFSVVIVFLLLMAGWAGVFGLSRETAHGVMLYDPPVQVESYYSDFTIGNAELMVYANGTVRVDIILRNRMESPSPLDDKIYHTFDRRPDWERYIARSRNIMVTMFDLQKGVGENLTFSTGYGTARAQGEEDELGRKCTTYLNIASDGTRQYHVSPGDQTPQPGMGIASGDYTLNFADPWKNQGGYLDEVRISWNDSLEELSILAWNDLNPSISYNRGNILDNTIGWKNLNTEDSPSEYRVIFKIL
jgi:hypothetical protein